MYIILTGITVLVILAYLANSIIGRFDANSRLRQTAAVKGFADFFEDEFTSSCLGGVLSLMWFALAMFAPLNSFANYMVIFFSTLLLIMNGLKLAYILHFDKKATKENEEEKGYKKKYAIVDITNLSRSLWLGGIVLTLVILISAFNWRPQEITMMDLGVEMVDDELEIEPPQTKQEKPPPPPPPPPQIEVAEEEILEEEPEIELDIEIEEDTEIEMPEMVEEETTEDEIFTIVEDMPRFPGCESVSNKKEQQNCHDRKLLTYLGGIKYPPIARENDIEGKVFIKFVIDKKGQPSAVEVLRGADKILNQAALKHIKKMPKWSPGKQRGQPVKVSFIVPIHFKLN